MKFSTAFDIVLGTITYHKGYVPNADCITLAQTIDPDMKVVFHASGGGMTFKFSDGSEMELAD